VSLKPGRLVHDIAQCRPPAKVGPEITSPRSGVPTPLRREGPEIILTEIGGVRPPAKRDRAKLDHLLITHRMGCRELSRAVS
jgi:hypothetical protein